MGKLLVLTAVLSCIVFYAEGDTEVVASSSCDVTLATITGVIQSAKKYRLQVTSKPGTYDQVRQECLELGGTLLSKCLNKEVNGASYEKDLNAILAATYPRPPNHKTSDAYWVGINQRATKGEWKFDDGKSFYTQS